jgi:hypothetical protein
MASIMLAAVASMIIATNQIAYAKESSCDVTAGGKCLFVAKKGDIEVDKMTIVVNGGGGSNQTVDLTPILTKISNLESQNTALQSQVNALSTQVANMTDNGITSIEVAPVNETGPVVTPPVEPPIDNGTGNNSTGNTTDTGGNSTGNFTG